MQNLLDLFKKLTEPDIEKRFTKKNYSKGLEYATLKRVYSWKWSFAEKNRLQAYVKGTANYEVVISSIDNLSLTSWCECPEYDRSGECKHCVAVFLMIIAVLKKPQFYTKLHALLVGDTSDIASIAPIIVRNNPTTKRTIIHASDDTDPLLKEIFNKLSRTKSAEKHKLYVQDIIIKSLQKNLLLIETEDGDIKPTAMSPLKVRKRIECVAQGKGACTLKPILESEKDGKKINNFTLLTSECVLDHETKTLINLNNPKKYDIWDVFYNRYQLHRSDTIVPQFSKNRVVTNNSFYNQPLWLITDEEHKVLEKTASFVATNNKPAKKYITPQYTLHLEADTATSLVQGILAVRCGDTTIKINDLFVAWYNLIVRVCESLRLSAYYLFPYILDFLSRAGYGQRKINIDGILEDCLKAMLKNKTLGTRSALKVALLESLEATCDFFETPLHLYFAAKEEAIGYCTLVPKNIMIVALEAFALWEHEKIAPTNDFTSGIFQLTKKDLQARIRKYFKIADKYKVALFLDQKKIKVAKTSFVINAQKNNLDWFKIAPEIKLDNALLSSDDLIPFLQSGMRETISSIELADEDNEEQFNFLKKYFSKKEKKDEVKDEAPSVVELRPLKIFELIDFKTHGLTLQLPKEEQEILDSLGRFKKLVSAKLPKKSNITLRNYQHDGFSWLLFLYKHKFGACLADDMGLGKTVQAITFLAALHEEREEKSNKKPHLIVVPPSLIFNWISEFKKFCPALTVQEYVGASRDDIPVTSDIVITTYDIVRIDIEKFEKLMFDVIVFDEAQMIKNITAKRTSAVRRLNSVFKLTLTGTPLENNIREFYSIMDLTLPGLLVDYEEFASWDDDYQLSYIVERTRPFILRRKKEVILHELPEKTEHDIYLPMNQQQKILYQKVVNEIKDTIANAYQEKTGAQATIIALTALLRLRQICVSPELIVPTYKEPAPKLEYLREKIVELSANKQAALVFSQFTSCLDIIEEHLKKEKISYLRIDGTVPVAKRKAIIEAFQDEKSAITVLLLSLKTGGVGLNLTRANYVFHVDPWWNPAVENQASDRAYRLGQKQHVFVTRLLMNHSIEEKMMHLKKEKADLFAAVLENSQVKRTTPLSKKDFDFLLT